MRIAIVHDKLMQFGGSERVALALREVFPGADLFTSAYDPELVRAHGFGEVRASFLQRAPRLERAHHYFLPLYGLAFGRLPLRGYDVVLSSASMFAKTIRPPAGTVHVCYCHTPVRFLWDLRAEALDELPARPPVRAAVRAISPWLRRQDLRAARRVDRFIANSSHVAQRIERFYGRQAEIIHPPVEVERYRHDVPRGDYFLAVARLFPHKRVDLVIEACNRLREPLKVIGDGPDRDRLEALAGPTVELLGWVDEEEKARLLGGARALVAPQLEDFGIAMAEAVAAATPVIALRDGGALDIVEEGLSGTFIDSPQVDPLLSAIRAHDPDAFDRDAMRRSAARFSFQRFAAEARACVEAAADDRALA